MYIAILVELDLKFLQKIVKKYKWDKWWKKILNQVSANNNLDEDKTLFLFELGLLSLISTDFYIFSSLELPNKLYKD